MKKNSLARIKAVFVKDWLELSKNKMALTPMVIVPLIFVVVLPFIFILSTSSAGMSNMSMGDIEQFIKKFPLEKLPATLGTTQKMVYAIIVFFFAPFFLIIPVMASSVLASNSFAGEKENKTIEGLLYTPITDRELLAAKILVSFVPSMLITWFSFIVYSIIVNLLTYKSFGGILFPTPAWLVLMFMLTPIMGFLSLSIIILVSRRAESVWAAQQVSALLIIPILGFILSQAAGLIYMNSFVIFVAGLIFLAVDLLIYRWIWKTLDREHLVTNFT